MASRHMGSPSYSTSDILGRLPTFQFVSHGLAYEEVGVLHHTEVAKYNVPDQSL